MPLPSGVDLDEWGKLISKRMQQHKRKTGTIKGWCVGNPIKIDGEVAYVYCRKGVVLIDAQDVDLISKYTWQIHRGYACSINVKKHPHNLRMARLILFGENQDKTDKKVDHRNRNKLDNRRINLREATPQQNSRNKAPWGKHKYKGISFEKSCKNPWRAMIYVNGKNITLGTFSDARLAAIAYDEAAQKYYGEFACLNFPERNYNEERELCSPSCSQ